MNRIRPSRVRVSLAVMGLAVLVSACGARREANFADAALVDVTTDAFVLMPIVDQRENRLDQFEVGRYVRTATDKVLAKKGYTILSSRHLEGSVRPPFEGIDGMSARELANLGPEGSEVLLFIVVRDVTHAYDALGEEYHVRLSGLLIDRTEGRVLWRDKSSGDTNFYGFMSLLTLPGSQYDAVYEALTNLFRTVPDFVDEEAAVNRKRGHS